MNTRFAPIAAAVAFVLASAFAASAGAQDAKGQPPPAAMPQHEPGMQHDAMHHDMANVSGMHDMPATVTNVDHKTGMVEVESMNMKLKVHFPANTIAELKNGDKITLHLGFSKQG